MSIGLLFGDGSNGFSVNLRAASCRAGAPGRGSARACAGWARRSGGVRRSARRAGRGRVHSRRRGGALGAACARADGRICGAWCGAACALRGAARPRRHGSAAAVRRAAWPCARAARAAHQRCGRPPGSKPGTASRTSFRLSSFSMSASSPCSSGRRARSPARAAGAAGAADAVHVVLGDVRQLVVHDVRQLFDVEAARGEVGRDEHAHRPVRPASAWCAPWLLLP